VLAYESVVVSTLLVFSNKLSPESLRFDPK
jgi:hypothetical protein